jgi:RNA polymerase sigma-70 factor (ECF subfamily)
MRLESSASELASSISTTLLARIQAHDQASWQRFVGLYAPIVYRWCRRWGVTADEAPDVVQDVFRRVARAVDRFDPRVRNATFRGWLWRIARNVANDYFARRNCEPRGAGGTDQYRRMQLIPEELPLSDLEHSDEPIRILHAAIQAVRGDVEPKTWEIFWRSTVLGHDSQDIANDFQMTPKAVRQAKHRVLSRLREEYHLMLNIDPTVRTNLD